MPIREAQILWEGPLESGTGTLSSTSGALEQLARRTRGLPLPSVKCAAREC